MLLGATACKLNDLRSRPIMDPNSFAASLNVEPDSLVTAPRGLRYQEIAPGSGTPAAPGDTVSVRYTGWLTNGRKFDSGVYGFRIGEGQVIEGWDIGLIGMRVGGRRKLVIPAELGYGTHGSGSVIPPNATLVFDVELLSIDR